MVSLDSLQGPDATNATSGPHGQDEKLDNLKTDLNRT